MAHQFLGVDPATGAIRWSLVLDQGYVPSLAEMVADNPSVTVLKVAHTPVVHHAQRMESHSVDVASRRLQRRRDDPADRTLPVKDRPPVGPPIDLSPIVDEEAGWLHADGQWSKPPSRP